MRAQARSGDTLGRRSAAMRELLSTPSASVCRLRCHRSGQSAPGERPCLPVVLPAACSGLWPLQANCPDCSAGNRREPRSVPELLPRSYRNLLGLQTGSAMYRRPLRDASLQELFAAAQAGMLPLRKNPARQRGVAYRTGLLDLLRAYPKSSRALRSLRGDSAADCDRWAW